MSSASEDAKMGLKRKLFGFSGRIRRRDWWLYGLLLLLLQLLATKAILELIFGADFWLADAFRMPLSGPWAIAMCVAVLFIWPHLALTAKRAHDRDKSAALYMSAYALFFVAGYVPPVIGDLAYGVSEVASVVLGVWLIVVLGFLPGTPGDNRHGPSPKEGERPAEVFS